MTDMKRLLLILFALILILSACALPVRTTQIIGSGNVISETRPVSNFDHVELAGMGTLIILQGEQEKLEISAEDNIVPKIQTRVMGGILEIGFDEFISISPTREITYTLTVKNLKGISTSGIGAVQADALTGDRLEIEISGAGSMKIKGLTANELVIELSGSGSFDLTGMVVSQQVDLSGFGNYQAGDLRCEMAQIEISGSGNATVWATDSLFATISGLGNLNYYGNPTVSQEVSGLGKVNSLGDK